MCLERLNDQCLNELGIYIKVFLLLYADDTILLAESAVDLQRMSNKFNDYCLQWKLNVNLEKNQSNDFRKKKTS